MDDKKQEPQNQEQNAQQPTPQLQNLQPEELPPDIETPDNISPPSTPPPTEEIPPIYVENRNKYIFIVVFVILFVSIFFLLIKTFLKPKPKKPITLTYWGLWEPPSIIKPLIEKYQKKHPYVKIKYELKDVRDHYREKLIARSQRGVGPDIFRFHNTWIPELKDILSYAPNKIISPEEFKNTFYPVHQKDLIIQNKIYGIPLEIDGLVLIYNEKILKAAGINTPPASWEDVLNVIQKTTVKNTKGEIITSGMAIGTAGNVEHFSDLFLLMLYQNGGDIKNLGSQEGVETLASYRKFAEGPDAIWNESLPNSVLAFTQEKVAMIIAPSWEVLVIKNINPEINVKTAPVPQIPGSKPLSLASYWVEGVAKQSKHQEEAWKFLKFLSQKENLTLLFENQARIRLFGEPYPRVDLNSKLLENPYLSAIGKQAEYFTSSYGASRTYDNGLNDEIIQYLENAINAASQGVSYQDAMSTAQTGVAQVLEKYNIK